MDEKMKKRGGKREGAGRKKLSDEDIRKMRSLRATDEEWETILKVSNFIKLKNKDDKTEKLFLQLLEKI